MSETKTFNTFRRFSRKTREDINKTHKDLASSLQSALEDNIFNVINEIQESNKKKSLCLAGGVALNCAMNAAIRSRFGFENVFIQPAAHDGGTALGAALEGFKLAGGKIKNLGLRSASLGPEYTDECIEKFLLKKRVDFGKSQDISGECAEFLSKGKVVAWFNGRCEYGPRALGNRSILARPDSIEIKDQLNKMKGRQPWRPFGPSILSGKEEKYFERAFYSPFMLFTFKINEDKKEEIVGVCHNDGTTRPQSVRKDVNPKFYKLIKEFENETGIPMIINTSFNCHNEPIVRSPKEALNSAKKLNVDYLAIGDCLVKIYP